MANIDVSDLLNDPDFVDPMTIVNRKAVVDATGENVITESPFTTIGSVQPISGKTLARLPDDMRVADVKSFWVKGKIISDGKCKYPDIICFKGERYAVQVIFDWTNWGEGYSEGTCVRERAA